MNMQIFKTAKLLKIVRISYKNINKQLICWLLGIYVFSCNEELYLMHHTKKAANQPLPSGGVYRGRTDDLMAASHAL